MKFVITGDFIDSVSFTETKRNEVKQLLDNFSKNSESQFEYFIRGDGMQILTKKNAIIESLKLKAVLHASLDAHLRLAIGVGGIDVLESRLSDSTGSAFVISGQQLDEMKPKKQLISLKTVSEQLNNEWGIYCKMLDYLEQNRTQNQSEAMVGLLEGKTQMQISKDIGISQPSVNQRIKSLGWSIIEAIILKFETDFLETNTK